MKKTLSVICLLLSSISMSFGQTAKIGVFAGLNQSNFSSTSNGTTQSSSSVTGFHVGAFVEFGVGSVTIQPALVYTTKGAQDNESQSFTSGSNSYNYSGTDKITLNYIEVPVNILYHIPVVAGKIFVGGGPYVALGLSGTEKSNVTGSQTSGGVTTPMNLSSSSNVTFGSNSTDLKNPDYGLSFVGGIALKGGLLFKVGYELGIANLSNDSSGSGHNNALTLSVGYSFL